MRRLAPTTTTDPLRLASALAAALALWLAFGAPLAAGETAGEREVTKIYEDCGNGTEPTGFSQRTYSRAIREMPPILAEYDNCPDLIDKAELAAASRRGGIGAGIGQAGEVGAAAVPPPTPTEQRALESIPHAAAPSVPVGNQTIHPGVVHVDLASALGALPTPLLVLLAFMLACAVIALAWGVRSGAIRWRPGGGPGARE